MAETNIRPSNKEIRASWIRLRTMITLRWIAIAGQMIAITVAQKFYGLQLNVGLCYPVVGASIIANLLATFLYPENKRLSEVENMMTVMFDLLQLSFLLFLTGGLNNPFAMLLLGPVTVSAAVLTLRSTLVLGSTAIVLVSILSQYNIPLQTGDGIVLRIPDLFVFGHWIALIIAIVFIGAYSVRVTSEIHTMSTALTATQMALAREQKLTDLGGVVAATAHELGTPLATIKLASSELFDELSDRKDLQDDARLIREQADRCSDILRDMGRAGKDDLHLHQAPLMALLEEAAEPHKNRGKNLFFPLGTTTDSETKQPSVLRKPEIIHGLRNLVQNAVDFSNGNVWVEANWTKATISVRIMDDGPGFPPHLLGRIGDPYMRSRRNPEQHQSRPEYEGMGLGLFIAKTMLERTGAELAFANGPARQKSTIHAAHKIGAIVEVVWKRKDIDAVRPDNGITSGPNIPLAV
ncbi:MAG: ActS/PrrB/RegB family redox-sensitive histidine kinase [Sulfitobacter sp.]